jgi:hypothetical protein
MVVRCDVLGCGCELVLPLTPVALARAFGKSDVIATPFAAILTTGALPEPIIEA